MDSPPLVVVDWPRAVRAIWARHLAPLGGREQGDRDLGPAWAAAVAAAWHDQWELRAVVPLQGDPQGHRWAVVLRRGDEFPAPNLVYVHGETPAIALQRVADEFREGFDADAYT